MKLKTLTPVERRVAAVGLLGVALALAYGALIHPWFVAPLGRIEAAMADLRATQSRYAAVLAQQPQLEQRLAALGAGQAHSSAFLPEDDPNAASAGLMQRVVDVVAAHPQGGRCEVTQKMPVPNPPTTGNEPYRKVAVNMSLRCEMAPLAAVLHDLEAGTPYLFVEEISLYRNPVAARQAGSGAPLEVQFTLSGYVRGAAPASAGGAGNDSNSDDDSGGTP
jgi:general secretion pathway protein M